jgi:hypothetical protein
LERGRLKMKKALITFITYDFFEAVIPDEVYKTRNGRKAIEIAQKQMLEELGYTCSNYDEVEFKFIDEED